MSNINNFYIGDEKEICEEIRAWSAYALEKPNPLFNNLPPCPYAKKAWSDHRVAIMFKYGGSQAIYSTLGEFNDNFDLVLIVDQFYNRDSETFHEEIDTLNEQISLGTFIDRDLWVVGFHPDDDSNDLIDDGTFEPHINTPYAMIFVQRLTKVHEASENLLNLGYYEEYAKEYNIENVLQRRKELYRRLKNGDESTKTNGNGKHKTNAC